MKLQKYKQKFNKLKFSIEDHWMKPSVNLIAFYLAPDGEFIFDAKKYILFVSLKNNVRFDLYNTILFHF